MLSIWLLPKHPWLLSANNRIPNIKYSVTRINYKQKKNKRGGGEAEKKIKEGSKELEVFLGRWSHLSDCHEPNKEQDKSTEEKSLNYSLKDSKLCILDNRFKILLFYGSLWSHPTLPCTVPFSKAESKPNLFVDVWQCGYWTISNLFCAPTFLKGWGVMPNCCSCPFFCPPTLGTVTFLCSSPRLPGLPVFREV